MYVFGSKPPVEVITLPPTHELRITFAPREMSSSAADSNTALPDASSTTCAESSAMFVKLEPLKKAWFVDEKPKNRTSRMSTAATQIAG